MHGKFLLTLVSLFSFIGSFDTLANILPANPQFIIVVSTIIGPYHYKRSIRKPLQLKGDSYLLYYQDEHQGIFFELKFKKKSSEEFNKGPGSVIYSGKISFYPKNSIARPFYQFPIELSQSDGFTLINNENNQKTYTKGQSFDPKMSIYHRDHHLDRSLKIEGYFLTERKKLPIKKTRL